MANENISRKLRGHNCHLDVVHYNLQSWDISRFLRNLGNFQLFWDFLEFWKFQVNLGFHFKILTNFGECDFKKSQDASTLGLQILHMKCMGKCLRQTGPLPVHFRVHLGTVHRWSYEATHLQFTKKIDILKICSRTNGKKNEF